MKKISVIIPCYNEEENIETTYTLVSDILKKYENYQYEIIFADNDSKDKSQQILRDLCNKDSKVKAILNNRNFGCDCSIYNALISASGDAVIWICCDRQDPPELISEFVKNWEDGKLVVWGQKRATQDGLIMGICRSLYYKIIHHFAEVQQYEHVIGIGLYDRKVVDELKKIRDPQPVLRNVVPNLGFKPFLIPYKQQAREKGKTSHNFFSLFDYAVNSFIHTSKAPMKMMIYGGIISGILSFLVALYAVIGKVFNLGIQVQGFTTLMVMGAFLTSVIIFSLGVIGEYLLSVLDYVRFNKNVIEKERINFDEGKKD